MKYIRKATREDVEQIRIIAEQCWGQASGDVAYKKTINTMVHDLYSYSKLTHEITNDVTNYLLAIDGEVAVAFASYKFDPADARACELISLYCLPQTQGKGINELLIKEVIKNTLAAGGQKIFVMLNNYNGPVSFFERMGFDPLKMNDPEFDSKILTMSKNIGIT